MVIVPAMKGEMLRHFDRLLAIVRETTGFTIDVKETESYQDAVEALKKGKADIGWLGTQAYLEASRDAGIEAFAVAVRSKEVSSTYRTLFVARADSEMTGIADMKGRRLILSEKGSTSGYTVPCHELAKQGLDPDNASEIHLPP